MQWSPRKTVWLVTIIVSLSLMISLVIWLRLRSSRGIEDSEPSTPTDQTLSPKQSSIDTTDLKKQEAERLAQLKDSDGDGLSDLEEQKRGSQILKYDTDGDGFWDGEEVAFLKTDPLKGNTREEITGLLTQAPASPLKDFFLGRHPEFRSPTDIITAPQSTESESGALDSDRDQLSDDQERQLTTNPNKSDSDGDGLLDGEEVALWKTDPLKIDTDGDRLTDYDEVKKYASNPLKEDSDDDGYPDGEEVQKGYNPLGTGKCLKIDCTP